LEDRKSGNNKNDPPGLESKRILAELIALARTFSIEVELDTGDFATSLCRIQGKTVVYINTRETVNRAADVIADALAGHDLDSEYILPEVRALLEGSGLAATSSLHPE